MSILKKLTFALSILALLVTNAAVLPLPAAAATEEASSQVRVYAESVVEDKSVTLTGIFLLHSTRYTVYLYNSNRGELSATSVGYADTDAAGGFTKTFKIPKSVMDVAKVGIKITSGSGDTATNWFINASASSDTGGIGMVAFLFKVNRVEKDDWVEIKTANMPANVSFDVRIGKSGTQGIHGTKVGVLRSEKSGTVKATFEIPDRFIGKSPLDIRVENKSLGISYWVSFVNK